MAWRARPLHTQSASTSPTTSENLAAGYRAGSRWTRVDTGQQWYLTDPAAGTWLSIPSGGVDAISVNGSAVVNGDFDDATPAAPGGAVNVTWQKDASSPANISAYIGGATTTARGVVELATDREDAANVVVQGNDTRLDPFVGSGASHATGLVPDPGAVAGTTKFLREDASWQVPGGSSFTLTLNGAAVGAAGDLDDATPAAPGSALNVKWQHDAGSPDNISAYVGYGAGLGVSAGSLIVADNGISDTKLRDSAALSVIGRASNTSGDPADIAAAVDGDVLRRSGTTLGFGTIPQASVVSLVADLAARVPTTRTLTTTSPVRIDGGASADLSANRTLSVLAATTTATGVVELATDREDAANVVVQGNDTRLDPFVGSGASHATGLVPDPGAVAGTTKFLREDATWQTPVGGAGVWGTASTDLGAAASGSFTITDAAITTSSRVIVQWVSPTDEGQFDAVLPSPRLPATGSVVVEWRTTGGPVASGTHTFWYSVG